MAKEKLQDYLELTKPRILMMQLVTASMGFFLARPTPPFEWGIWAQAMIGTAVISAGAATMNHYIERDLDRQMDRTKNRALPSGKIQPNRAKMFGIVFIGLGTLVLWGINWVTGALGLLTALLYVLVYTPMKRKTWLNTFVGALPGALPPVGGWAAATGNVGIGSLALFLILFTWQHPHFYAIAIMYKEDYRKAGFKMLPVIDPEGTKTNQQTLFYTCLMIASSVLPVILRLAGWLYLIGAVALGLWMLKAATALARAQTHENARKLLIASVIYLPVLLILILVDVLGSPHPN